MNNSPHLKFWIGRGITFVAIALLLLGTVSDIILWLGIALALVATAILFTIRCSHCGYRLVRKGTLWLPNYCPHCGEKISSNEYED